MKYLVLVVSLIFVGCSKGRENNYSVSPVREPFEYVITSENYFVSAETLISAMNKQCNGGYFTVTQQNVLTNFTLTYFRCKVGR